MKQASSNVVNTEQENSRNRPGGPASAGSNISSNGKDGFKNDEFRVSQL